MIKTDFFRIMFQKVPFLNFLPITHKRFIFEHSYISYYGKRQKSCTLIVILVISTTSSFAKKKPVDFDDEIRIGDVRYDNMI